MVIFPPYLASATWYAIWLGNRIDNGGDISEAVITANKLSAKERDFARTKIRNNDAVLLLSAAVEGGAGKLKDKRNIGNICLSDHGDWRRTHMAAIEASYGRAPFFSHIIGGLHDIYADFRITKLEEFNLKFHSLLVKFLLDNIDFSRINLFKAEPVLCERGKEIAENIKPEISALDAVINFGPEAILGIFALYNKIYPGFEIKSD